MTDGSDEMPVREASTRDSYDAISQPYTDWIADELTAKPHTGPSSGLSPNSFSAPDRPRSSTSAAVPDASRHSSPLSDSSHAVSTSHLP
ncbi:hypothetical protein [Brevibacterium spongiae]|uniref:Uncharacterized protein n=1 Tax=Brevibacterium spongiae TaxID=2909672 RepID=A0ABY5SJG9_9MICO|nr:hypothetical protein [Brevibacterium spongiae]UVI34420.1 hypothetical protein L1F31_09695 [Brevibacterium spongiae]